MNSNDPHNDMISGFLLAKRAMMSSETWVFKFGRRRLTTDTTVLVWRWETQSTNGTNKRCTQSFESFAASILDARGKGYAPGSRMVVEHADVT
jgi:hypothetical protein